jgi:hypothetical protein
VIVNEGGEAMIVNKGGEAMIVNGGGGDATFEVHARRPGGAHDLTTRRREKTKHY